MSLIEILVASEALLFCAVLARLFIVERRLRALFGKDRAKTLEGTVAEHAEKIATLENNSEDLSKTLEALGNEFFYAVQRVGIVRFNPFANTGGDQSFAVALLDRNDNGIVISSLYSNERQLVYAKPIENGKSTYNLTKEEKEALSRAHTRV